MLKRIITIALVVAVLGIIINDAYQYSTAQQKLRSTTYDLATWAAQNASQQSRDEVAAQLAAMATAKGIRVYQYGQDNNLVRIWTDTSVGKTFVAGTIINMIQGKDFAAAKAAPWVIRDYREAGVQ